MMSQVMETRFRKRFRARRDDDEDVIIPLRGC